MVDPIVASFSGGAVGVISALMLIEANNVEQQEKKKCKYCHGTGMNGFNQPTVFLSIDGISIFLFMFIGLDLVLFFLALSYHLCLFKILVLLLEGTNENVHC